MSGEVVRAVAGAGKTTWLVERYIDAVVKATVPREPSEVAVITFTDAAARELLDRIREELTNVAGGENEHSLRAREVIDQLGAAPIGTIHSFARRILLQHAVKVGIPYGVEVLDGLDEVSTSRMKVRTMRRLMDFTHQYGIDERFTRRTGQNGKTRYLSDDAADLIDKVSSALLRQPDWADISVTQVQELEQVAWERFSTRQVPPPEILTNSGAQSILTQIAEGLNDGMSRTQSNEAHVAYEALLEYCAKVLRELAGGQPDQSVIRSLKPGPRSWDPKWLLAHYDADGISHMRELAVMLNAHNKARPSWLDTLHESYAQVAGLLAVEAFLTERAQGYGEWLLQDELLQRCWQLAQNDELASLLRSRYPVVLLDEAQDVDATQKALLLQIAGAAGLTVVGDPQQSIYGFRGADHATFDSLQAAIDSEMQAEHLATTYRCLPVIVEAVNRLFAEDSQHTRLNAHRKDSAGSVTFLNPVPEARPRENDPSKSDKPKSTDFVIAQADAIGDVIVDMLDQGTRIWDTDLKEWRAARPSDIAILVKSRTPVPSLYEALKARGIEALIRTSRDMAKHPYTEGLVASVLALANPDDTRALLVALRSPVFACRDDEITRYRWDHGRLGLWVAEGASGTVADALATLDVAGRVFRDRGAAHALAHLLRATETTAILQSSPDSAEAIAEIRLLIDLVADRSRTIETGPEFATWLTEQVQLAGKTNSCVLDQPAGTGVTITTIHQAKGLQWPIIVTAALTDGGGSGKELILGQHDVYTHLSAEYEYLPEGAIEDAPPEVSRLLYVALTRARDHLVISGIREGSKNSPDVIRPEFMAAAIADLGDSVRTIDVPVEVGQSPASAPKKLTTTIPSPTGPGDVQARLAKVAQSAARTTRRESPSGHDEPAPRSDRIPVRGSSVNAAAVGELVHTVLEHADFVSLAAESDDRQTEKLLAEHAVRLRASSEEALAARELLSDVGSSSTIRRAAAADILRREVPISGNREDGEVLVVTQGIIDLLFAEEGDAQRAWILADYKTDSTGRGETEFVDLYKAQLNSYRYLLREAGICVTEMWLVRLTPEGVEDVHVPLD